MTTPPSPAADAFETVIGLETHVQLKTASKLFCSCAAAFGQDPNSRVCPVCSGMPGVLPALNGEALRLATLAGLAFHCTIAESTKFDRKNYFYPDLPKGYQISQYDQPLATDGWIEITRDNQPCRIGLERIHMEEDAGKLLHANDGEYSQVDLNRAGTPLIEMVSRPDLRSPAEAHAYLTALKQIVRYIGVSDCDMEKGTLRVDGNISVRSRGEAKLGTKVEIKNVNSFKFLQAALELEQARQIALLRAGRGGDIKGETRLYDSVRHETRVMRSKEAVHDYRFFPDPDLLPVRIGRDEINELKRQLPELPAARYERFKTQYQLSDYDARELTTEKPLADYFETVAQHFPQPKVTANWILGELLRVMNEQKIELQDLKFTVVQFAELLQLAASGQVTNLAAKEIFQAMAASGQAPQDILNSRGLKMINSADALEPLCRQIIAANPKPVEQYRSGKPSTMGFLVGQIMKQTQGKADPNLTRQLFEKLLAN